MNLMKWLFLYGSYGIMTLLTLGWGAAGLRFLIKKPDSAKRFLIFWIAALVYSAFLLTQFPPRLRVLSDETNLVSVSRSFYTEQSAYNHVQGTFEAPRGGNASTLIFHPLESEIPNRPLLFPHLLQWLHWIRGYELENAYILNWLALSFLCTVFSLAAFHRLGGAGALAALLLVPAVPEVLHASASAGYDILSVCLLAGCFYLFGRLVTEEDKPDSARGYLLFGTLVAYSHSRYESFVVGIIFLGVVCALYPTVRSWIVERRYLLWLWTLASVPIFLQHLLRDDRFSNYSPTVETFSWINFISNVSKIPLGQPIEHGIALLLISVTGWFWYKKQYGFSNPAYRRVFLTLFLVFTPLQVLYFSHYGGTPEKYTQLRFFISLELAMIFLPFLLVPKEEPYGDWSRTGILLFAIMGAVFGFRASELRDQVQYSNATEEARAFQKHFLDIDPMPFLIISDRPGIYLTMGFSSISFDMAVRRSHQLQRDLKEGRWLKMFALQKYDPDQIVPWGSNQLSPDFLISPKKSYPLAYGTTLVISEVLASPEKPESFESLSDKMGSLTGHGMLKKGSAQKIPPSSSGR